MIRYMKKNRQKIPLAARFAPQRLLLINAATLAALAVLFFAVLSSLKQSGSFLVDKVIIREKGVSSDSEFSYFRGKNIFALDLAREAERFAGYFPNYKMIRLTRFLPDCVFVDFQHRNPVAVIASGGGKGSLGSYLDENMIFFEREADASLAALPVITGMEKKAQAARPGRRFIQPEIALAFGIIKVAQHDRSFRDFRVMEIDVSSLSSLSFLLALPGPSVRDDWLEVRVGGEEVDVKLKVLSNILAQLGPRLSGIKYIDLRFKEPVIKFKNIQKLSGRSSG